MAPKAAKTESASLDRSGHSQRRTHQGDSSFIPKGTTICNFTRIHPFKFCKQVPVLIHEAILINIWKHKVLPEILRLEINPDKTFVAYAVLFHEGTAVALLELCMFHENCVETLEDSAMDLLDYVSGTVSQLLVVDHREPEIGISGKDQLKRQQENLAFDIGIRSLSIIRYLAEYMER